MKQSINRLSPTVAVCTVLLLLAGARITAVASQIVPGHVPRATAGLQPVRQLDGTNQLKLAISLPLRDKVGLTNLLQEIYDPTSPNYHHYLSAAQFAERFGPTEADYQALKAFVISNNFGVIGSHPNRTLLDVSASVADIDRTFHLKLQVYQKANQSRTFYAPDSDPMVNLGVPLLHIAGLDNAFLPFPKWKRKPVPLNTNGIPRGTGSGPYGCFQGYDFRDAYVPGVALTGTGQSVALFELDGYYASDITAYVSQAGLPSVPLVNVLIDGFNGTPQSVDGEIECTLDIDMAIAMAPGISDVYVYQGYIPEDILNRIATDNLSRQISSSWGWEPFDTTINQIFQEYALQGQTYYDASGDDCAETEPQLIVPPSDNPYITQVGGTTLTTTGPLGAWSSETVWNWGGGEGSSGGSSFTYPIPAWQQGINMSANGGSTNFRNYPDVALTADNIYIIADQGIPLPGTGGTSCAAPLWAGFTALVNQQAAANGEASMGFINPAIYSLAESSLYDEAFHDITTGNDTNFVSPALFYAFPGYDLCTGWGTPAGSNLINALAPIATAPFFGVVTNIITGGNGNGIVDFDECNNLTIILTNGSKFTATGVEATLASTTVGAIVAQGTSTYPNLFPSNSAANLTPFTLSTQPTFVCGTPIDLTLVVKCDQVIRTNFIRLPSGVLGTADVFSSTTPMVIPNTNFIPVNSPILVSGLDSVGSLTVSVFLSALYDEGLTLQLISPGGTSVMLSENNGGTFANYGIGCGAGAATTFDDSASLSIQTALPPYVGNFLPQEPLSAFHLASGTNLNGTWNLQVLDEFPGDTAVLNCWSLNISPEVCVDGGGQCPGADLSLTMSAAPNPVFENSNLVYTLTVSNAGPGTADNVVIVQSLPSGVGFVTTSNYPVNVNQSGSNLDISLNSLPVYGSATVSVVTIPTIPGLLTSTATVGAQETDPNPDNNTASASVLVSEETADLSVSMAGSPTAVLQGGVVTYTINVTNNGPFTAGGVTLDTTLPANANFVSATASQGSVTANGAFAALGSIGTGTNVVVTIQVSPTITGNITASTFVSITNTQLDPNAFNNSATVSTTVGPSADLGVSGYAKPSPVIVGSNLSYVLTVVNSGPSAATGVQFSQSLPTGSTFVSSSLPNPTVASNLISATLTNNFASGASIQVTNILKSPALQGGATSNVMTSTITVSGQPGDPNTNNNVLTLQTTAELPVVTIVSAGATVTSGSSTGSVGPAGTYGVLFYLQNVGTVSTTNLVGTLLNSNGVTLSSGAHTFGALLPGSPPAVGQYSFTANSTNGGKIVALLQLQDGSSNLGTVSFTFVMPVVQSFQNTAFISIPNQIYVPSLDDGPANPYPSTIAVSGVNGTVSAVSVTVSNLFHTYPNDIGMLLVGPTGASCVLMSAAAQYTTMSQSATVTFSQSAPYPLPDDEGIVTGSFQPADYYASQYGVTEKYTNASVPVGPYNTNLAVFSSIAPNGTWSLYVYDFALGDAGAISNGWSLNITTITPVNQIADLAAGIVASANPVIIGNSFTNIWTVTNNGPDVVSNVFVTNVLPAGLSFVANILPPGATSSQSGATNFCNLGVINPGGIMVVTNVVTAISNGPQTNVISVGSILQDPDPVNNTASVVTTVNPPPVSLSLAPIAVAPNPVVVSNKLVYTLWVTNNGPSNALGVVGTFSASSSFRLAGSNISQGNFASGNYGSPLSSVVINLGTIASGFAAEVVLTNTALSVGLVTNVWSVATSSSNLNFANNSTTAYVTVAYPAAVISNGPVTLTAQAAAPFNGAINSNQTNTVSFTLTNIGSGSTTNLWATLQSATGIRPVTLSNYYGAIPAGGSAAQAFTLVGSGSPGAVITAELTLKDGINTSLGPVFYTFTIPMTQTFSNSGVITIPYQGPATPYPSQIQVTGMSNLLVSQVTATLNGFAHSWPHDVEAVLVSPSGQELALMEHTGSFYNVSNLLLTFEDAAAKELPLTNALTSGTFLATEYSPFDILPGLAPVPAGSTNLGVFNGISPDGIWSLYVYDDSPGNNGIITNGWSLGLTAVSTVNPAALLAVSTIESPNPAVAGGVVSYQVTVENLGPNAAAGVYLTNIIPAGTTLESAPVIFPSGSSTTNGRTLTCNLGTISNGASATVTIQVTAGGAGFITNTAIATTASADLYLAGSTSILTTPVIQGLAPAAVSAALLSGGTLQLNVNGSAGQSYSLQSSTNLFSWKTVDISIGTFTTNVNTANAPQMFYRVIPTP